MFIDTHAHLFYDNFQNDLDDVIKRAKENSIDYILVPSTDIETAKKSITLSEKYDFIYVAVGVHPHETKNWDKSILNELKQLSKHNKVVAIGEIGLDYYYDFSPKEKQIEAFKDQINLALELELPIIIHNRDSDSDMFEIISSYCSTGLKAQFHCFNASLDDAIDYIKMNHFISFTGNVTYKKSDELRKILKAVDVNHLLLETDAPFMSPMPYRGKRNEPSYLINTVNIISELKNLSVESVGKITSLNAFRIFGIGKKPETSFTYQLGNSLYINVTNRCNADCIFCRRKTDPFISGYNLGMKKSEEPPADVYIREIGDPSKYDEIVFCGYGEPTLRWEVVKEVAEYVKKNGGKTRLNTNGHGNFINKRNIIPEMKGKIDTVSISLNSTDADQYSKLMRVDKDYFNGMINFAKESVNYVDKVIMTVVDIDDVEIPKAKQLVENEIKAEFRIRNYF
ncbi:MAG: YchF/TatD family DNA exonuclease [Ignavibacterium sp.]|nr:YchF/TatD family DNA exonuclease [Ignavibacterium sp.]